MKIICAWCEKEIGEKGPPEEGINHTICGACLHKYFPDGKCVFFSDIVCRRVDCRGCEVFLKRLDDVPENICAKCGTDKDVWQEVFNEKHTCYVDRIK